MGPIKLIIIALLLYLGYRLLASDWKKKRDTKEEIHKQDDGPIADVLVEDPVCHKLVPREQAVRLNSQTRGEILYFCSEECCNLFVSQEGEKK
ncbi:hypothetical protein UWK_00674 [Desulfocapsa sulfexigens DSM 10523]|uniref:TRASH domain-containing protein n=1 Tax=Desulfocapsa sulfexigens (strain DSM 10523 / SB164P1) TaxID=1167006 RepID=M1NBR7_DESSD|nr:hypothetical protein [Desulfocapsa sulfexigens]AGF77254.1 hypothetical protein UWK_00674 [Desulfocapsa sulfexigens DSM 10523]